MVLDDKLLSNAKTEFGVVGEKIFDSISCGIVLVSATLPDYPIVKCNEYFLELTGYSSEEVIGRNCRFLQAEDTDQRDAAILREALANKTSATAVLRNYKKDGALFWSEISISPLFEGDKLEYFVGFQRDVTESEQRRRVLEVQNATTEVLASATSIKELIYGTLRRVCENLDWSYGVYWGVDAFGNLLVKETYLDDNSLVEFDQDTHSEDLSKMFSSGQGAMGNAWVKNETVVKTDLPNDPTFLRRSSAEVFDLYGMIAIPLNVGGTPFGVIEFVFSCHESPTKTLVSGLEDIVSRLSLGIYNLAAQQDEKRNLKLAATIGRLVSTSDDINSILQSCANTIVENIPGTAFARIWLLPPASDMLELVASSGLYTHLDGTHSRIKVGEFKIGRIAETKSPHLTNKVQTDPNVSDLDWAKRERLVAFAGYPLIGYGGQLLGVLALFSREPLSKSVMTSLELIEKSISMSVQRRRAVEELESTRNTLQSATKAGEIGLWEWDLKTNYVWYSPEFRGMLGYSIEEFPDSLDSFNLVLHPEDYDFLWSRVDQHFNAGDPYSVDVRLMTKSGDYRWFHSQGQVQANVAKMTGALKDITDRKLSEEATNKAHDSAERASQLKSQFVANMSHEIRTPLNAVIGMTNSLIKTPLDDGQRRLTSSIRDAGRALLAIVNDILDFSKIEAGKMDFESVSFDLLQIVEETCDLLASQALSKKLSLASFIDPDFPTRVSGDPDRLRQVLTNLISNAIKFTKSGHVHVRAAVHNREGNRLEARFSVSDTGIGISDENAKILFTPFSQTDSSHTRNYGGTGLGLSISKNLVELMGGSMGMNSREGEGSTFYFTLPLEILSGQASFRFESALKDVPILIVDDDPYVREAFSSYALAWGMAPSVADSKETALKMLRQAYVDGVPYKAAIVDLVLSEGDESGGLWIGEEVRKDPTIQQTKLLLLTAFDTPGMKRKAKSVGFEAYLSKPVRQSTLLNALMDLLVPSFADRGDKSSTGATPDHRDELILVAEDHPMNQEVAQMYLHDLGFTCHIASNGQEAVEAVLKNDYSLVLMDCQMPQMDGYEATRVIRNHASDSDFRVPIVAMTAHAMKVARDECLNAGMDDYITKPVDFRELKELLGRFLPISAEDSPTEVMSLVASEEPTDSEIASQESPLDFDALSRRYNGRHERLFEIAASSTPSIMDSVEKAYRLEDIHSLKDKVHALQGTMSSICAVNVWPICESIALVDNSAPDWVHIEKLISRLKSEIDQVLDCLARAS